MSSSGSVRLEVFVPPVVLGCRGHEMSESFKLKLLFPSNALTVVLLYGLDARLGVPARVMDLSHGAVSIHPHNASSCIPEI